MNPRGLHERVFGGPESIGPSPSETARAKEDRERLRTRVNALFKRAEEVYDFFSTTADADGDIHQGHFRLSCRTEDPKHEISSSGAEQAIYLRWIDISLPEESLDSKDLQGKKYVKRLVFGIIDTEALPHQRGTEPIHHAVGLDVVTEVVATNPGDTLFGQLGEEPTTCLSVHERQNPERPVIDPPTTELITYDDISEGVANFHGSLDDLERVIGVFAERMRNSPLRAHLSAARGYIGDTDTGGVHHLSGTGSPPRRP